MNDVAPLLPFAHANISQENQISYQVQALDNIHHLDYTYASSTDTADLKTLDFVADSGASQNKTDKRSILIIFLFLIF